ncbi:malto-oligosyltrehalose synthase [Microbacterium sp.]|uniref:malto-oligosyltrehalose synthase n=1 Tax=Microbacterium sp. TaxID=51671 RepID=UPI0039E3A1ED
MTPSSTYRLQLRPGFGLDAAAALIPYLRDLGVGWVYLSPILQAAGSEHGYDVVDPTTVDAARGGPEALARLADAAHEAGLGVLVDIVPNHLGVGDPAQNPWWWDVLLRGPSSAHAAAFDIDWDAGDGRVLLPILGEPLEEALAAEAIAVGPDGLARYGDHELPLAEGTAPSSATQDADLVRDVLARQHWAPIFWRRGDAELNYRRFFTIASLAGVRVEDPDVFDRAHGEILRWVGEGLVDGLRIDHPDGLADPRGYLERLGAAVAASPRWAAPPRALSDAAGEDQTPAASVYTVIEKILEPGEQLPPSWAALTAGTTGYDALAEIDRVLVDPAGRAGLDAIDADLRAETGAPPPAAYDTLVRDAKRAVAGTSLRAEVARLVRVAEASGIAAALGDATEDAIVELLAAFPVYRAYLPDGVDDLEQAVEDAASHRPDLAAAFGELAERMWAHPESEFTRRFMQTAGPVMAKGVEDRTFYRYTRLTSLTEVGGDPAEFGLDVPAFHAAASRRQADWPHTMTALSTHDTKRSEDVRARLAVLAEVPERWAGVLGELRQVASTGDGPFDNLLWQAVVGVWPAAPERLRAYAIKAARESGEHTSWTDPDPAFEERVSHVALAADGAADVLDAFVASIDAAGRSNALSAKLLQLAGPGVPDVYQGTELWDHSLVDPDNRRPVDFERRRRMLAALDAADAGAAAPPADGGSGVAGPGAVDGADESGAIDGVDERDVVDDASGGNGDDASGADGPGAVDGADTAGAEAYELPPVDATGMAKMLVTARTLRLRRDRPELFTGYAPVDAEGPASGHVVAFDRGGAIAVATRLPVGLAARGGWDDTSLILPPGTWRDVFTGTSFEGDAPVLLADLLATHPVALLAP